MAAASPPGQAGAAQSAKDAQAHAHARDHAHDGCGNEELAVHVGIGERFAASHGAIVHESGHDQRGQRQQRSHIQATPGLAPDARRRGRGAHKQQRDDSQQGKDHGHDKAVAIGRGVIEREPQGPRKDRGEHPSNQRAQEHPQTPAGFFEGVGALAILRRCYRAHEGDDIDHQQRPAARRDKLHQDRPHRPPGHGDGLGKREHGQAKHVDGSAQEQGAPGPPSPSEGRAGQAGDREAERARRKERADRLGAEPQAQHVHHLEQLHHAQVAAR